MPPRHLPAGVKAKTYRKLVARKLQEDALKLQQSLPNTPPPPATMAYSKNSPAGQAVEAIITDLPSLMGSSSKPSAFRRCCQGILGSRDLHILEE